MAFDPEFDTNYLKGRALAKTDHGIIALVPVAAQSGD